MRILWLVPALPWPLVSGEKLRSWHLAVRLARHHELWMVAPAGDEAAASALVARGIRVLRAGTRGCSPGALLRRTFTGVPLTVCRWCGRQLRTALGELTDRHRFDLVYYDHLQMTGCRATLAGIPAWLDEHNLESRLWARYLARSAARVLLPGEAGRLRRWEAKALGAMRGTAFTSAADLDGARELQPAGTNYTLIPNGVATAEWIPADARGDQILLAGSLDWPPNRDGIEWFLDGAWPMLKTAGLKAMVVGSHPPASFRARCAAAGVDLHGDVPEVQPYYQRALAVVVPLRVGGGTRLKVLEAFAAGVPVVATTLAVEGIDALPGQHYLRADTPEAMAREIIRLRDDEPLRRELAAAARQLVEADYDWDVIAARLETELKKVVG